MGKRIVVASGKGGVGKTTLSIALSLAFARRGKKVLLVDFDELRSADLLCFPPGRSRCCPAPQITTVSRRSRCAR